MATSAIRNHLYCYLYSRDIEAHFTRDPDERKYSFQGLVDPSTSDAIDTSFFEERRRKLVRLFTVFNAQSITEDVLSYDNAINAMPQWNDPENSYIFYRDARIWQASKMFVYNESRIRGFVIFMQYAYYTIA